MEIRMADAIYANSEISTELVPITRNYKKKAKKKIERIAKRTIDIVGGLAGTVLLLPLTMIIYIANLIEGDNGPIFYTHKRIGRNGKLFKMYKFRSMVVDADEKLYQYLEENEEAKEEYAKYKKLKYDPRVTKVGAFIRKTSIDEFPQFINVLKGDMSLVGPRPYLPREKEDMKYYYPYIIQDKPGITGFWQVAGRSDVTFEDRLKMDFNYSMWKSFRLDVKLLLRTVVNVVRKEGAI